MKAILHIPMFGDAELRFPFNRWLVESLKAEIPASSRSYDPTTRAWTVSGPYIYVARRLLTTAFPDAEIIDQSARFNDPSPPPRQASGPRDAYVILHLQPTAPPELVEASYRCLSRLHHPDRGGDTETMQAINEAVAIIRKGSSS